MAYLSIGTLLSLLGSGVSVPAADSNIIPIEGYTEFLLWASVAVAALVGVLVIWAIWRYRARAGDQEYAPQIHGNTPLEIGWTVAPAVLLAVLFGLATYFQLTSSRSAGAGLPKGRPPDIIVIAHQFWWEFRYPKLGIVTANEFHIPVKQDIVVQVESDDVIHDLWMPALGEKMDAVPGQTNYEVLYAPKPGSYNGACAEYCGAEHAWMRPYAVAQTPAEFRRWVRHEKTLPAKPTSQLAKAGEKYFMSNTCIDCHTIAGTKANGRVAPDLTHFGSRKFIGAGVMTNRTQNLKAFLKDPQAVKPGILMPDFHLSDQQVNELTAYLEGLK